MTIGRSLKTLQGDEYTLVQNDEDLTAVLDYYGIKDESITGAVVRIDDGEYSEVWLTEDSRYYDLSAWYRDYKYYL